MTGLEELQSCLGNWPCSPPTVKLSDNSLNQLRRLLVALHDRPESVGVGDLAGVVRHAMRSASLTGIHGDTTWKVPQGDNWPTEELWLQSGVAVVGASPTHFLLRADLDWSPDWLEGSRTHPPLKSAFLETDRRQIWPASPNLPLDPALQFGLNLDFTSYSGPGQRQAIQAAYLMKRGATLVVNLPTGSGKSLVAWAPALSAPANCLTVMVTPTIALALDQERQLRENYPTKRHEQLPEKLAWHGGLEKEKKQEIREQIRNGTQRILITSPESLVGGLARSIYDTAKAGRLAFFVVDEAHLVSQWGNEFRPEFQSMCGMHRELLKSCPVDRKFRTLLLSATLTQDCFNTLRELFPGEQFDYVCGVALRPEPEYWIKQADAFWKRTRYVKELVRVVPRPFLLYVTTKDDAKLWHGILASMDIRRCGLVHGASSAKNRERVIDQWRDGELDCVVATSAFGLGMDKSDVRTVIHACVPESVDRFYQEVGRSGRDGRASVSFLIHEESDLDVAHNISSERIITVKEALPRWESMMTAAESDGSRFNIRLDDKVPKITQDTESNENWNLSTLVLLHRAKVIRLESSPPPEIVREDNETDEAYADRVDVEMRQYRLTVPVSILNDANREETLWQDVVEATREIMQQPGRQGMSDMRKLLRGDAEIGEVLCKAYELTRNGATIRPAHVCAGCPVCRREARDKSLFQLPEADLVTCIEDTDLGPLRNVVGNSSDLVFISCNADSDLIRNPSSFMLQVLRRLVSIGVAEIALPDHWTESSEWKQLHESSPAGFVIGRKLNDDDRYNNQPRVPRVSCFLPPTPKPIPQWFSLLNRPLHIVFADENTPHRELNHKKQFDYVPSMSLHDLLRKLQQ